MNTTKHHKSLLKIKVNNRGNAVRLSQHWFKEVSGKRGVREDMVSVGSSHKNLLNRRNPL